MPLGSTEFCFCSGSVFGIAEQRDLVSLTSVPHRQISSGIAEAAPEVVAVSVAAAVAAAAVVVVVVVQW